MEDKLAHARRWVELYNERSDAAEFVSLLDPDVELQTPGGPRLHGHDQARQWFEREPENVQARIIPDRFIEGGDAVVGLNRAGSAATTAPARDQGIWRGLSSMPLPRLT